MKDIIIISLLELLENGNEDEISNKLKKFSCHIENDLEDFLHRKAIVYEKCDMSRTYLILDNEILLMKKEITIIAFFSIGLKPICLDGISKKHRKKLLGRIQFGDKNHISAHLIGQLGRCDKYKSCDLSGDFIMMECLNKIHESKRIIGGRIVIVECKRPLLKFYEKNGFTSISNTNDLYQLYMRIE